MNNCTSHSRYFSDELDVREFSVSARIRTGIWNGLWTAWNLDRYECGAGGAACSLLEDEDITLILRNTGICSNILEEDLDSLPGKLVSRMPGVSNSYILVNGNNRLIFHIDRCEE